MPGWGVMRAYWPQIRDGGTCIDMAEPVLLVLSRLRDERSRRTTCPDFGSRLSAAALPELLRGGGSGRAVRHLRPPLARDARNRGLRRLERQRRLLQPAI